MRKNVSNPPKSHISSESIDGYSQSCHIEDNGRPSSERKIRKKRVKKKTDETDSSNF